LDLYFLKIFVVESVESKTQVKVQRLRYFSQVLMEYCYLPLLQTCLWIQERHCL
jgi:hypothetical protein